MDHIESYLDQFADFELAFFYKYRLETYMEETQNLIKTYIKKRNLDETKMKALVEEYANMKFPDNELRCPRCKSQKLDVHKGSSFGFTTLDPIKYIEELIGYKDINSGKISFTCKVCDLDFPT